MKNRILAMLLSAVFVFGCIPINAFAVEEITYLEPQSYTYVNPEYAGIVDEAEAVSYSEYIPFEFSSGDSSYNSTAAEVAEELREGMINREPYISIYYTTPYDGSGTFSVPWDDIWAIASAHGTDPKGGDYISHQGTGYSASTSSAFVQNGNVYCVITYQVKLFTTAEQEAEVDAEIDRVLGSIITDGMDDYQKVNAIYDYMCANITYDYANLNDSSYMLKHSAYAALINKTAVCQGYALLFYRMALEVGMDARYISGIGNGSPHGWNIVELEDLYYNLDSTWDAGRSTYDYFLRSNANFGDHTRDGEYNSTAFITEYPMDTEDYVYEEKPSTSNECGDGVVWNFDSETGTLYINYTGTGSGEMYDYTTWEPSPWNEYNNKITKCIIEDGVTSVGVKAFEYCSLSEVILPSSLKSIGDWAFYGCEKLRSIALPDGLLSVGNSAFTVSGLTEVTIPASLTTLGEYAFGFCHSFTQVTFAGNVPNTWGEDAITESATIYYSEGTTGWTTPTWTAPDGTVYNTKTIAEIIASGNCGAQGDNVKWMLDSTGLLTISGSGEMKSWGLVREDGILILPTQWGELFGSSIKACVVEDGVTTIGYFAFYNCIALESIKLPDSLTTIGQAAFMGCDALTSIDIPDEVITIKDFAFSECKNLININLSDSVITIDEAAFYFCQSLVNIELPDSITTIGDYAFMGCNKLISIDIPNGVTTIGKHTFNGCEGLKSINLPDGLTTIDDFAFWICRSLTSIEIPDGVTTIGEEAFCGCESLTSIDIPDGVTMIGKDTFNNCKSLIDIKFPERLTTIGEAAFMGCDSLTNIDIPDGVMVLGWNAFSYCDVLTSVKIPDSLTTIGSAAFYMCELLTNVTFEGNVPSTWGTNAIPATATIYYTEGTTGWTTPTWTAPDGTVYNTVMIEASETKPGDIDGNDTIDVDDVLLCLDLVFVIPTADQIALADLDKDGDVDVDDVLACLDLCFA